MICERYHRRHMLGVVQQVVKHQSEPRLPRKTVRAAPSIIPTPRQHPGATPRHPQLSYSCFPKWTDETFCEPFSFEGFVQNELYAILVIYLLFKAFSICLQKLRYMMCRRQGAMGASELGSRCLPMPLSCFPALAYSAEPQAHRQRATL